MQRRILLLITDLEIGGTPTVVRELAIRLRGYAHVEVACLKKWGPVADQLRDAGVTVTAFDASRAWHLPGMIQRVRKLVRESRIDTVFSFLVHANHVAAISSRKLPGVRFLQSIQTVGPRPKWHWWLQGQIWRSAEAIVVPSAAIVETASKRCGIPRERFAIIPNALDPAEFGRAQVFQNDVIRVGYLGRLDPAKNPGELMDVAGLIGDSLKMQGHYFGDGPARKELEARARAIANGDRIQFHGTVTTPQEALRQMDILLLPSRIEGFGLVLIEAMASGVPVIAFGSGGVTDVVTHEHNGLLANNPEKSTQQFADCIRRLVQDKPLRERLISNGLITVRQRFGWDAVLPQYLQLLGLDATR